MEAVLEDLDPEGQGNVEGFFDNNENVGQLGGFVEGIRYAMMEYQVCALNCSSPLLLIFLSDFTATRDIRCATGY